MSTTKIKITGAYPEDFSWHEVITFAKDVAELEEFDVAEIEVDEVDEECAFASVHERKIYLFTKSKPAVLHELAHLDTMSGHTLDWAICFAYLCKKYLTEQEYLDEMFKAEKRYKDAMSLVQTLASLDSLDETKRWAWGKTK